MDLDEMMDSEDADVVEKNPSGRYIRYRDILGKGASKTVFKGFDLSEGLEVAWNQARLEDVSHSPQQVEQLYLEVRLLKSLKHKNIMQFYDYWVNGENKTVNMITELFTSGSLRQYRKKHKKVEIKAIKNWARQILLGLQYLHTHNPVIIHRDLKCDNIFVNGNNGKVKIGDLGLASLMQQPMARTVVGTPEFMAPEIYDEEYNELVDIYSFGMCILEMVTCEYPYSECSNPAQIYRKVTSCIKPASLAKVKDPQVKEFIEKCLVPASQRLSAAELLKDPFLASENSHIKMQAPEAAVPMGIDLDINMQSDSITSTGSTNESSHLSEFKRSNENIEVMLKGQQADGNIISFTLRIVYANGRANSVGFSFDLDSDTALSIACDMVTNLELANEDIPLISELLDSCLMKTVPSYKSSQVRSDRSNSASITASTEDSFSGTLHIQELLDSNSDESCCRGSGDIIMLTAESYDISLSSIGSLFSEEEDQTTNIESIDDSRHPLLYGVMICEG